MLVFLGRPYRNANRRARRQRRPHREVIAPARRRSVVHLEIEADALATLGVGATALRIDTDMRRDLALDADRAAAARGALLNPDIEAGREILAGRQRRVAE